MDIHIPIDVLGAEQAAYKSDIAPMSYMLRSVRLLFISLLLALALPFLFLFNRDVIPVFLRRYFEYCGGMFVKFGQILATRYDILQPKYTRELASLLDQIPPTKAETIIAIIEADLGREMASAFRKFEKRPLGVGSIAQVHKAQLHNGDVVVVKVKRPTVQKHFQIDAVALRFLAWLLERLGVLSQIKLGDLVHEMLRAIQAECDFRQEARNLEIFNEMMREDEIAHRVPQLYPEYCGESVIVMEHIEGVWLYEILAALDLQDSQQLARWQEQGIDAEIVAQTLLSSIVVQCFRHHVFHGDLHAANIVVLPGNQLIYIDLGRIGWLDEQQQIQNFRIYRHLLNGELQQAYQALLDILIITPNSNLAGFEGDVKDLLRQWLWNINSVNIPSAQRSTAHLLFKLLFLSHKYGLAVPTITAHLYYVLITADTMILHLSPSCDRLALFQTFILEEAHYRQRRYLEQLGETETLLSMAASLVDSLQETQQFLRWIRLQRSKRSISVLWSSTVSLLGNSLLLLAVLLIFGKWISPSWFGGTVIETLLAQLNNNWWLLVVGLILLWQTMQRIAKALS